LFTVMSQGRYRQIDNRFVEMSSEGSVRVIRKWLRMQLELPEEAVTITVDY